MANFRCAAQTPFNIVFEAKAGSCGRTKTISKHRRKAWTESVPAGLLD